MQVEAGTSHSGSTRTHCPRCRDGIRKINSQTELKMVKLKGNKGLQVQHQQKEDRRKSELIAESEW